MFQLIGSLLAFFAIISAVAGAPLAGAVFALLTFIWVVVAKPARRSDAAKDETPWDSIYETRFSR
ncbi:MAG: hypothetical protein HYX38_26930 [Rhodospirillales bacterium]|nr:hypothetical protein [Rhodospirillales bacterium]